MNSLQYERNTQGYSTGDPGTSEMLVQLTEAELLSAAPSPQRVTQGEPGTRDRTVLHRLPHRGYVCKQMCFKI